MNAQTLPLYSFMSFSALTVTVSWFESFKVTQTQIQTNNNEPWVWTQELLVHHCEICLYVIPNDD